MSPLFLFQFLMRDFLRARRVITWIVVILALFAMAMIIKRVSPDNKPEQLYPLLSGLLVFRVLPLAAAILCAQVVASEIEQKTIVYLLTRPAPRAQILLSRLAAAITMVLLVSVGAALAVSIAAYGGGFLNNPYLWRDLPALVVGAVAYSVFFVFISLLINRSMIFNLLFAFAWEVSIPNMPGTMYMLSINSYLSAISERPATPSGAVLGLLSGNTALNTIGKGQGWAVMLIFCVALGALATWWFSRFEYTPREDAE